MNKIAASIRNRLSLRPPQADSLEILSVLADKLTLKKGVDLVVELEKVKKLYPTCSDFERLFPSICFSLATGVGKTRLMGAFISYLYLSKGIKNYFVLAPNLTIYNKLIDDFQTITSPKYVFQGIGEFVGNPPEIITGDNYNEQGGLFKKDGVKINIFNISKINAETRKDKLPRIKRLSEYLGDSYFNYLSNLDELVVIMDESHHYRADRGMDVINELNPIVGLELTATPQTEQGGRAIKFKNVVFEYSLAKAIKDGFVKEPAVATRKDFNPDKYSAEDLDRIKLEDGVKIHEDTKVSLDIFGRDNKTRIVKPFVLVVAKDTIHAGKLKELIISPSFFNGYYADKVMEIHSNQTGEEKDENIQKLLSLESFDNKIEIVIHVNMLKEGWDVTNLYTIIPLRTSASQTLTEQTIGRGLRLPYGMKTNNPKVDKLTIVSHDRYQEIIDEANKPGSIIKKENIIEINDEELNQPKEAVTSLSVMNERILKEEQHVQTMTNEKEKAKAQTNLEVRKAFVWAIPEMNTQVTNINDLKKPEIKKIVLSKIKERIYNTPQQQLFAGELVKEAENAYDANIDEFTKHSIEIPRITIQQSNQVTSNFKDFDLDTKSLNYQPSDQKIVITTLRDGHIEIVDATGNKVKYDKVENILVNELMGYSEIDYDRQSPLLFKLANQAIDKLKTYLNEEQIINVVQSNKREIGRLIYAQLMEHFYYESPRFETPVVKPFTEIEPHNFSKNLQEQIYFYKETITPTNSIPTKVFSGFQKACHQMYKFANKTEKDFATLLEQDDDVIKWLKPAQSQFHIYWGREQRRYQPDFVVETINEILLIETKKEIDINTTDVQEKKRAAFEYCKHAAEFTSKHGGKPWKYLLIPHTEVQFNMGLKYLSEHYGVTN